MTQLLSVSKAARLANVSRSAIQKTIRAGKLKTFEGEVRIQDLLRVFPRIDLDADPVIEHIEQIKSNASASFPWQQKKTAKRGNTVAATANCQQHAGRDQASP